MHTVANAFLGRWRILEMDAWDREYVDLVVPGYIQFETRHSGEFQFGIVSGGIDWRLGMRDGEPALEWCWNGWSETDPSSGRGWSILTGKMLVGHIYIFAADDSGFAAQRIKPAQKRANRATARRGRRFALR